MLDVLRRAVADLTAQGARFALVGGHAVSVRTEPRFTRDVDLAVAVADDRGAEEVAGKMAARGHRIVTLIEQKATGRLATVRLEHPSAPGIAIDLLFATAGVEAELVADATVVQVTRDLALPVAGVGWLLALKTLSVARRGAHRGRDLRGMFARLQGELRR